MNIDLGPMYQLMKATSQELKNVDRYIRHAAKKAIDYEKANHPYVNRTGNLELNTVAQVQKSANEFSISLQMNTDYASYVVGRGYSKIETAAAMMEADIDNYLQRFGFDVS